MSRRKRKQTIGERNAALWRCNVCGRLWAISNRTSVFACGCGFSNVTRVSEAADE